MAGYLGSVPVPQATQHRETFTATAAQTTFNTAGYTPQFIDVYLNGVHLSPADVTATNGSDVVLAACLVNDIVDVVSYTPFEVASQTFTGTTTMTDVVAASLDISGDIDVDGTTNLDIVDIDGAVNMASTLAFNAASSYASVLSIREASNSLVFSGGTGGYYFNRHDNSATDIHIDATGAVTMPLQPAFQVIPASNQNNIAIDSNVTVVFGTERFDKNADFASNTFTAPVTGVYQLNAKLYMNTIDTAADYYEIQLRTSNKNYFSIIDPGGFSGDLVYFTLNVSVLADMDASDTVFVAIRQVGGTAQTDITTESNFSGYLVA
jgi:hypothetical protein